MKKLIFIFTLFLSGFLQASEFPGICDESTPYEESSLFVRAPAAIAGCIGGIVGIPIGAVIGLPVGEPVGGGYVGALITNYSFNSIIGAPFYVVEYLPKKIISSIKTKKSKEKE